MMPGRHCLWWVNAMLHCKFCGKRAVIHITVISNGSAEPYHVCRDHAVEDEPQRDGVTLPDRCPICGCDMRNWGEAGWNDPHCAECDYRPRPG